MTSTEPGETKLVPRRMLELALFDLKTGDEAVNLALATDEQFHQMITKYARITNYQGVWHPSDRVAVLELLDKHNIYPAEIVRREGEADVQR